jgi:RsmE family RNA methyltransferase
MRRFSSKSSPHLFSLFVNNLEKCVFGSETILEDPLIVKRIRNVLRITPQDSIQLFDGKVKCMVQLMDHSHPKQVRFRNISSLETIPSVKPEIRLHIGLLKKDGMEEIARICGVLGVSTLIPIITDKVQREWGKTKERERLEKIIISGCEQSKNCVVTTLKDPSGFKEMIQLGTDGIGIHFDPHGTIPLIQMLNSLETPKAISLFVGSEADLTQSESDSLQWNKVSIGKSVLTSVDATLVGIGAIKSMF